MNEDVNKTSVVLEVIVCSIEDAVEAKKGGAHRLEVIRDLESGGFTPTLDLVGEMCEKVALPVRVMLREQPGFHLSVGESLAKLSRAASALNDLRVDGVVLGFLKGGQVDVRSTRRLLSFVPGLKATFHHAFEETGDKLEAINELKRIEHVDRILSHGGFGPDRERIQNLSAYASAAGPEIEVLAGGRIDEQMIRAIGKHANIREFHVGRAARENGRVRASRVEALVKAARRATASTS